MPNSCLLRLAEGHRPDLLLTDIEMPGLTGYDVLERVHRIEGLSRLPVVATTSHSLISADDFKHRGFADVLFKPFTQNDLRLLTQKLSTGNEEASAPTAAVREAEPTEATDTPHETAADKKPPTATFAPLLAFCRWRPSGRTGHPQPVCTRLQRKPATLCTGCSRQTKRQLFAALRTKCVLPLH